MLTTQQFDSACETQGMPVRIDEMFQLRFCVSVCHEGDGK